jgi:hypothetical protein
MHGLVCALAGPLLTLEPQRPSSSQDHQSLFSPYLATSSCEHAAIAAESGITTGILVELPSAAIGSSM